MNDTNVCDPPVWLISYFMKEKRRNKNLQDLLELGRKFKFLRKLGLLKRRSKVPFGPLLLVIIVFISALGNWKRGTVEVPKAAGDSRVDIVVLDFRASKHRNPVGSRENTEGSAQEEKGRGSREKGGNNFRRKMEQLPLRFLARIERDFSANLPHLVGIVGPPSCLLFLYHPRRAGI